MQTYPLGIALKGAGGRKTKQDRHIRSARQRRKAYKKEQDALLLAVWKHWGDLDKMPLAEQAKVDALLSRLRSKYDLVSLANT